MRLLRSSLCLAALVLVVVQFAFPTRSRADTYLLSNLGKDNEMSFLGLSSSGLAFFKSTGACANYACYLTYFNGAEISASSTVPHFTLDDGTLCTPTVPAEWVVYIGVCNNGRVAWTGSYDNGEPLTGVYFNTNPIPPTSKFGGGAIFMNNTGDVIFDEAFKNNWWEAVDLTTLSAAPTPEPASLLLLATGILALGAMALRRKPFPQS